MMEDKLDFGGREKVKNFSLIGGSTEKIVGRRWGKFVSIEKGEGYQVKRLTLDVGKRISLQKHLHRSEHWVVVSGVAGVVLGDPRLDTKDRTGQGEFILRRGESTYVSVGCVHRLENIGKIPLEIIEVQLGEYLGEDDIERFDDVSGLGVAGDLSDGVDLTSEEYCIGEGCGEIK